MLETVVVPLLKIAVLLNAVLVAVTFLVLMERKVIAWAQSRLGPMRVGPYGILQAIADPIKLILKEDITPAKADKYVFTLAPIMSLVPALVVFSVVPFGPDPLYYVSDINVGLLFIIAVTSIGVYGIILGGWASNSKYPLLASLRASAQLISYEIAVTMTLVSVILTTGTLSLVGIVEAQREGGLWFAFVQPVALVLIFIGGLAETNRAPFDLPEAETELTGGFHTELQRDALLAVLPGRVRQHDRHLGGRRHHVLRGLAGAVSERAGAVVPRSRTGLDLVHRQDLPVPVRLHLDSGHAAPLPVRPVDGARLEGAHPDRHRQPGGDRHPEGGVVARGRNRWPKR